MNSVLNPTLYAYINFVIASRARHGHLLSSMKENAKVQHRILKPIGSSLFSSWDAVE